MSHKIPSNRKQRRFLLELISYTENESDIIQIDERFNKYFDIPTQQKEDMLKALVYKGLIQIEYRPKEYPNVIYICEKAFAYIPDYRENLIRFSVPIVISSCLSVAALIVSLWALFNK